MSNQSIIYTVHPHDYKSAAFDTNDIGLIMSQICKKYENKNILKNFNDTLKDICIDMVKCIVNSRVANKLRYIQFCEIDHDHEVTYLLYELSKALYSGIVHLTTEHLINILSEKEIKEIDTRIQKTIRAHLIMQFTMQYCKTFEWSMTPPESGAIYKPYK